MTELPMSPMGILIVCGALCLYFAWTTVSRLRVNFPPEAPISADQLQRLLEQLAVGAFCRSTVEPMMTAEAVLTRVWHLYPELVQRIECWCQADEFVLFSLDHGQLEKRGYLSVLITKLGTNDVYQVEVGVDE